MPLKALVFDAYGTLFDVHSVIRRCEQLWPGKGERISQLWRSKQLEYTWQRSLMRRYEPFSLVTRAALDYACEILGAALGPREAELLMRDYLELAAYPDVAAALEKLSALRLAILSNGSPDMLDPLVKHCGMERVFAAVISVDELRVYKPAPEVYALAVSKLGVSADEIGFVSSNCWDAIGAKSFGLSTYWINRGGAPVDRLGFAPDRRLNGLGELPALLAR
ncbi:MAG: haloacid dehalogenase type II [Betaproteobacteria bacterium]|nr:haloacid dehalogenase type II [Betaproteobacteria bacterium]